MAVRLGSSSGGSMGSGCLPIHEGSQPVAIERTALRAHLPTRYGIPLFELLVVDPDFIFISWEITNAQLDDALQQFDELYDSRRLRVLLFDDTLESQLASRELYGEIGRWFIQLDTPGVWLRAELQLLAGNHTLVLNTAGPVFVPRDAPVEAQQWEELFVNYSRSDKGVLQLDSVALEHPGWPSISRDWNTQAGPSMLADHTPYLSGGTSHSVNTELRPLLPVAPVKVEERDD